jgi:siroheme synthase (precorrin-2 oxidase/ferrochelatase)
MKARQMSFNVFMGSLPSFFSAQALLLQLHQSLPQDSQLAVHLGRRVPDEEKAHWQKRKERRPLPASVW